MVVITQETINLRDQLYSLLDKVDDRISEIEEEKQRIYMHSQGSHLVKLAYQICCDISFYKTFNPFERHSTIHQRYQDIYDSIMSGGGVVNF
jgi:hypothetical protein